jgi:hypothetical protein
VLNENGERVFAVVFDTGEDPMAGLTRFAEEHNLSASGFTAIGAFSEAMLGYFDWEKKEYERIPVHEQTEVLALLGDIAVQGDHGKKAHAHVVLGRRDGTASGGCRTPRPAWRCSASAVSEIFSRQRRSHRRARARYSWRRRPGGR